MKTLFAFLLAPFFMLLSLPLLASDDTNSNNSFCGITVEPRVAYFHPSSKRVKRIYGNGWADYQLEFSKSFKNFDCGYRCLENIEWRIWTGISGFSKEGKSIGFHDTTRLHLIPISLGLKMFYPILCNTKVFIGGAACYSLLRIHDHSRFVNKHIHKESWGGLFQSGITYDFCNCVFASVFFDYYFQHFHKFAKRSGSSGSNSSSSGFVERFDLNMNGYKLGVGLGILF